MADSRRLPTHKMYTIGWIAALHKELTAALAMLDETHGQPDDFEQNDKDSNNYSWGRVGDHNIVIASLGGGSYGLVSAATTATCMANSLPHLRFGLLVGIGAGVPGLEENDVRLGDVVVSLPKNGHPGVVQYDLGKIKENDQFQRVGALAPPPTVLLKAVDKLRAEQRLKGAKLPEILSQAVQKYPILANPKGRDPAFVYQGAGNDRLFESNSVHVFSGISCQHLSGGIKRRRIGDSRSCNGCDVEREIEREERPTSDPEIHYGTIASGNLVIKDGVFRDKVLKRLGTDVLCYEMEAAGLISNFPCLVIRGICDYADSHKNDRWQNYAALAAAAYAKELLSTIDARKVERADKMEKIVTEVSDTKQAVQGLNDKHLLDRMYAWLSAPDPSVNYQTALSHRHTGTCDWFLRSEHYERWKMESASSLWIYGKPGCGKTVLSSVIVSDLKAFEDDTQHLLFFFFSFTDSKKQSLDGVVRCLISQLSRKSASARAYLTSTFSCKHEKYLEQPSTAQLCEIFECMLQRSDDIWVVLDALDECQPGSTFKNEGLLSWLQYLLTPEHGNIRTLVTSRREHNIRMALDGCIHGQLCLQSNLVAGDIHAFIDETIKNWDGLSTWQEHKWVQEEIRHYLKRNSDGMFRWVSCQLDALAPLQGCRDHEALLATLESLPKSLDGTYERMLGQIPRALRAKANRILQFLLYSETPLYLEEIVEIAIFSPKSEKSRRRFNNTVKPEKDIISLYCPNLVECMVVTTDRFPRVSREVLQLAHRSVRDFLLCDRLERSTSSMFQPRIALGSMAETCLSYLLDIDYDQHLDQILSSYPLAVYSACFWTHYAKQADTNVVLQRIQEFIHRQDCYQTYCRLLDVECEKRDIYLWRARWLESAYRSLPCGRDSFVLHSMLEHFAMRGLLCAVEVISYKDADAIVADGAYFGNAVQEAALAGHKEMICLLLDVGANPNVQGGYYGNALQAAASRDDQEAVEILLNAGANPNVEGGRYGSALQVAASEGHQDIVRLLLDVGADPNSRGGFDGSPLNAAVVRKDTEVIQMLLDAGADPYAPGEGDSGSALYEAACRGIPGIMQMFLDAGADPDTLGNKLRNSLTAAVRKNRKEVVEFLLPWKVKVNNHDILRTAASAADVDIIKLLLQDGATVDENAFWAAFTNHRDKEVIEILLESITLTDIMERCLSTALQMACLDDRLDLVQVLLDAGANVTMPLKSGDTALYVAASRGLESVFELFLNKAYAVSPRDGIPDSFTHNTSLTGCTNVTHLLLMEKAEAKRLLGKALAFSSSPGSRDAAKLLFETCQIYYKTCCKRAGLNRALSRELKDIKKGADIQVKLLLDQGADPNVGVSNPVGVGLREPGLCYLIKSNMFEVDETFLKVIKLLLDHGADATIRGAYGCPLDVALRGRRWELVGMLRDRGVEKTQIYRFMEAKVDRELRRLQEKGVQD